MEIIEFLIVQLNDNLQLKKKLEEQYKAQEIMITSLNDEINKKNSINQSLTSKNAELVNEISGLKVEISSLNNTLVKERQDNIALKEDNEKLLYQISDANKKLKACSKQLPDKALLKEEYDMMNAKLLEAQTENVSAYKELNEANKKLNKAYEKLGEVNQELKLIYKEQENYRNGSYQLIKILSSISIRKAIDYTCEKFRQKHLQSLPECKIETPKGYQIEISKASTTQILTHMETCAASSKEIASELRKLFKQLSTEVHGWNIDEIYITDSYTKTIYETLCSVWKNKEMEELNGFFKIPMHMINSQKDIEKSRYFKRDA